MTPGTYETPTHPGLSAQVEHIYDDDGVPWEDHERELVRSDRSRTKRAGEVVIHYDQGTYWFYNLKQATAVAKAENWGWSQPGPEIVPMTPGQARANAVQSHLKYFQGFLKQEWWYIGVRVTLWEDGEQVAEDSVWHVESNAVGQREERAKDCLARALHTYDTLNRAKEEGLAAARALVSGALIAGGSVAPAGGKWVRVWVKIE